MAQLLTLLGVATVLFLIVMYMRYAPRFAKDEEGLKVVRADRVRPGHALPRRDVDISQAAPVVVAPPAVPVAVGAPAAPHLPPPSRRPPHAAAAAAPAAAAPRLRPRPRLRAAPAAAPPAARRRSGRSGRARRGRVGPGGLRREARRTAREGDRPPRGRGPGAPGRHDRSAEEGRRGLVPPRPRWTPPTPSTGRWAPTRPVWPTGSTAVDIGRRVSGPGVPVPGVERARLREDMAEIVPRAEGLIRGFTDMEVQGFRSRAWVMARSEWIRANLNGLQRLLEPLAERMLDGRPTRAELQAEGARRAGRRVDRLRRAQGPRSVRRVPAARRRRAPVLHRSEHRRGRTALLASPEGLPVVDRDPRGDPPRAVRFGHVAPRLPRRTGGRVPRAASSWIPDR